MDGKLELAPGQIEWGPDNIGKFLDTITAIAQLNDQNHREALIRILDYALHPRLIYVETKTDDA